MAPNIRPVMPPVALPTVVSGVSESTSAEKARGEASRARHRVMRGIFMRVPFSCWISKGVNHFLCQI
ncbi:hypothetical protein D9M70_616500 [compost metagenome]